MKAHGTQLRASGDPYFSHPVEVAGILTEHQARHRHDRHRPAARHGRGHGRHARRDRAAVRRRNRPAGRRRHQARRRSSCNPRAPSRPRICASSCSPCPTTSASCWSSSPTGCTTCARCITSRSRTAPPHRPRDDGYLCAAGRADRHASRSRTSSRIWPSASSSPRPQASVPARCGFLQARRASEIVAARSSAELMQDAEGRRARGRRSPAARSRPIRSGGRCSARTSASSSSPTSWRSACSSTTSAECYQALGVIHRRWPGGAAAVQGLHLDAEAQRLPLAAHRRDRPGAAAHRDADPHRATCTTLAEHGVAAHWTYKQGAAVDRRPQYRWLRDCSISSSTPPTPRNFSSTPSSRCSRTRSSASRPRAS